MLTYLAATYLNTGVTHAEFVIPSDSILEIEIETQTFARNGTPTAQAQQSAMFQVQPKPIPAAVMDDPAVVSLGKKSEGQWHSPTVQTAPLAGDTAIVSMKRGTGTEDGNESERKSLPKVQTVGSNGMPAKASSSPLAATFDWKLAPPQVHRASIGKGATPRSQNVHRPAKDLNPASHSPSNAKWGSLTQNFIRPISERDMEGAPLHGQAHLNRPASDADNGGILPSNGVNGPSKSLAASKSSPTLSKVALDKSNQQPSHVIQDGPSATLTAPFTQPTSQIVPTGTWFSPSAPASARQHGLSRLGTLVPGRKEFLESKKATKKEKKAAKQPNDKLNASATIDKMGSKAAQQPSDRSNVPTTVDTLKYESLDPEPKGVSTSRSAKTQPLKANSVNQNGWATEEATDIQDMGDFDFESNLSKFDKRGVFEQIRQEDTTADEERLHTFNRKSRPGTAGGKNLHYTENVLSSPKQTIAEQSSADDDLCPINTVDRRRRASHRNVRQSRSKRGSSSQKGSGLSASDHNIAAPGSLTNIKESHHLSRVSSLTRKYITASAFTVAIHFMETVSYL